MDPSRRVERADMAVLCAIWLAAAALLGWFAGADVSGLDAGEIGGAAWSLGVAHPTGFPLDMLLLRAASLVPLGPLAFRQNLGVAMIGASAVTAAAALCLQACTRLGARHPESRGAAAWVCASGLIASATFLRSALSVEVYSTSLLCLLLSAAWLESGRDPQRRALMPLFGFGLGAHVTAPLLSAPVYVRALWGAPRRRLVHALVCTALAALVIAYLPLASRRMGAFDWGHPASLLGLWRHLSAARIREAFAPELFAADRAARARLLLQLTEAATLLAAALVGLLALLLRARASALMLGWVLTLDLAYASWINPMGVADRQVGHATIALIGVFAGAACGLVLERARERTVPGMRALAVVLTLGAMMNVGRASWPAASADGHAVAERYGALSPLTQLPPRAVYVCESDSACAAALFAVYAEGARSDLAVVPQQHLWDASVLRRLRGLELSSASALTAPPAPELRHALAVHHLQQLMAASAQRPLYFESLPAGAQGLDAQLAPYLRAARTARPSQLEALVRARFGAAGPRTELARELWSRAYEALGKAHLQRFPPLADRALEAFERALTWTPDRAALHSNLGVAYEQAGELARAIEHTARAVELDPKRATPWVNLTRLLLRARGPEAARVVLSRAMEAGIADPRLDAIAKELRAADAAHGTTRR